MKFTSVQRVCEQCGATFLVQMHRVKRGKDRFCSPQCAGVAARTSATQIVAQFWKNVDKTGECWLWTGWCHPYGGYGRYRSTPAHRFSWTLHNGPIPDGLFVCHTCDVRNCVNPAHLWLGTCADNLADMWQKGRGPAGELNGHATKPERTPRGETQGLAKLTDDAVRTIRARWAAGGVMQIELAAEYDVTPPCIGSIVRGKTWKHLL